MTSANHQPNFPILLDRLLIFSTPSAELTLLHTSVSSANFPIVDIKFESISLISIRKRTGPKTEPCGTPLVTFAQSDDSPSTHTFCLLLSNHPISPSIIN